MDQKKLLMAEIAGVHGVRGAVKLKIFGDDAEALPGYGPLLAEDGKRSFTIRSLFLHGNIWLAEFEGLSDRTAAEKLHGTKLYVSRDKLPGIKKKNTFYHADLIGLKAVRKNGQDMGAVVAVANFGAGDLLEIRPPKGNSFYIPFTDACVPEVDVTAKTVTIDPPEGLLD